MELSPEQLAAQLRHPSGPQARAVAEGMNRSNGALNHAAIERLDVRRGESVLEIGPGNAAFAARLLRAEGTRYTGVDASAAMVAAANDALRSLGLEGRARVLHGDSSALPLDSGRYDAALCVNTLYFWERPSGHLRELARVLRPGGRLCLAFGDAGFMRTLPFAAHGFHLHPLPAVEAGLRQAGFAAPGHALHCETGTSNDGRRVHKRFHLLLASRD
ncbi:methyltransferase domain-containing protein [Flavobacterium sp. MXW15]|uniref:Methyltransferase domain-containing protein n=1 Tax=Xanthomonas chitinilytica TaxID=2989819 RepID=A0ABT3JY67_9XANT|nr:methyltransferase domain-containing protein [Xanthomonas sp. H13-6]MCW4455518.1 methyltransferase domain-containing protein [Flavobacterium sp. MXW15]MCW4473401.1 methyltransferase domain-containing protein [Xanthomonas sp. H13-6]